MRYEFKNMQELAEFVNQGAWKRARGVMKKNEIKERYSKMTAETSKVGF